MNNENELYQIMDLDKFIEASRILVFDCFGQTKNADDDIIYAIEQLSPQDVDELNTVLAQEECMVIAKEFIQKKRHKKTKHITHVISSKNYMKMIESFNSRLISNLLNSLASKGLIESAYDSESNDFVFWIKNKDNDEKVQKRKAE